MTIKNAQAYVKGIWDWAILEECFSDTGIAPTDLDGFVERKGQFLVLETKGPNADLTDGQRKAFEELTQDPRFTIMVIWGQTNDPERLLVMYSKIRKHYNPATLQILRERVTAWFDWVNG